MTSDALSRFSPATREWFAATFAGPTPAQAGAWEATAAGHSVLVSAPTGSGKTLAAFLWAIDGLMSGAGARPGAAAPPAGGSGASGAGETGPADGVQVLYVSPLKALAYDVDRNLRAPLVGIARAAERLGLAAPDVTVGMRTGDTSAQDRRRMARTPPDVLITTPESLFLLLTSQARSTLATVRTVIVDEVHAIAGTKRGAHLALSLERLEALRGGEPGAAAARPLQRVGLSATQRPLDVVARFLGGGVVGGDGTWEPRPVRIVEAPPSKVLDLEIVVPVEDMGALAEGVSVPAAAAGAGPAGQPAAPDGLPPSGPAAAAGGATLLAGASGAGDEARRSIWPEVYPRLLQLVLAHRSTIVFVNSRRLAERVCARLNELQAETAGDEHEAAAPAPLARAHHGSVSREERVLIEEALKQGSLRCVVATSSLELGIDMGAVDLVVQVASPGSVSSGLQRIGRAGHQVGAPSVGKIFPKYRGDLVECAVVARRMLDGAVEETRYPRNPLDVLAQQVVAMGAMDPWPVQRLHEVVRGAASFAELSRTQLDGVLDMLSGRYPSDEFAELRPRLNWDRVADAVSGRTGAQRLAVTSGGTIPDRGLYGVFLAGGEAAAGSGRGRAGGRRVGELDEEMVYETRPGETILLGSTTWRIEDITRDQVLVTPAPGEPGKLPFWHGDALGRPVEVGRAVGAFLRETGARARDEAVGVLQRDYGLDPLAAANLVQYLAEQREATGVLPSDRTIVVERFRDEIGDWRVVVHSPFGGRVHAPWALAIEARARDRLGLEVQTLYADDGIVVRVPEADQAPPAETVLPAAAEVEDMVVGQLGGSALFAARFRECAGRALLLPRRRPGGRTPLWQQRQKAADLLAVASRYGSFPVLLETYRECLQDVFDLPGLLALLGAVESRSVRVVQVETAAASPFASSLLFDYVAGYMYEGDAPLAERRASALALDRDLLAELLGSDELRELVDPSALADLELELQRLATGRRARGLDGVHDLLREVGDLRTDEVAARTDATRGEVETWLDELERQRRAWRLRVAGEQRWAAAEDAARFRDALGVPPPPGLPEAFGEPVARPLVDLVARFARTHGPFRTEDVAARLGLPPGALAPALAELERERRVSAGEFRPGGLHREWCDVEVLRRLRRRSLAVLRKEVEPVEPVALARFLPLWQAAGAGLAGAPALRGDAGVDRVLEAVEQLQGAALTASALDRDVLGIRVPGYTPAWLDELCATGEVVWVGRGGRGADDGRIGLYLREQAPLLAPVPAEPGSADWWSARHDALVEHLAARGPSFWPQLYAAAGGGDEGEAVEALWDLVWGGWVTGDALTPLRALVGGPVRRARGGGNRRRAAARLTRAGPPRAAGRWSLVADLLAGPPPGGQARAEREVATQRVAALAAQLLDRYGVVTRDAAAAEELAGGFAAVYPALKVMEEAGRARRGYFVEGLGGAQFALPGAVDRLRSVREPPREPGREAEPETLALAATDPANAYGAVLPWPEPVAAHGHAPKRVRGAYVVLVSGALAAYVEKGGRSLVTFSEEPAVLAAVAAALAGLVRSGRSGRLQVQRIDAEPVEGQPLVAHLRAAGFTDHPRGLLLR